MIEFNTMGKRIILFTLGTRGDVQPFVALGIRLREMGHHVYVVTNEHHFNFVTGYGLAFRPISVNLAALMTQPAGQAWLNSGRNPLRAHQLIRLLTGPLMDRMLNDAWAACQGGEMLLCTHQSFFGHSIAEALQIPLFLTLLHPLARTRAFPNIFMPQTVRLGGTVNWLTHRLAEWLAWLPVQNRVNRWRRDQLNLSAYPLVGPFTLSYRQQVPHIYAFSKQVIPPPPDWPGTAFITGFWFLPPGKSNQMSNELASFLAAGSPPMLVSFGSAVTQNTAPGLFKMVGEALRRTGMRGVFVTGNQPSSSFSNIFSVSHVPFDQLLPHVAGAIIHGGVGTAAACLRAGVPMITVPFMGTQNFWSRRLAEIGAATDPIPWRSLTSDRLVQALETVLRNDGIRTQALAVGQRIRAENGVGRAVSLLTL